MASLPSSNICATYKILDSLGNSSNSIVSCKIVSEPRKNNVSFIKTLNYYGPSIDPYGTPDKID